MSLLLRHCGTQACWRQRDRLSSSLRRFCPCVLYQGSALSVSHLAAGCAHRSAHRRFSHSRRRAAEDGNLRTAAFQPRALSRQSRDSLRWLMITLAVIGIIYGALVAMVQPDVKRLVAYSSVSHMGFVVLGLVLVHRTGHAGRALSNAESRRFNRRAVPVCRLHLRTAAHAHD